MTGAYLRVERDGEWQNIEVENLTDKERGVVFKDKQHDELLRWLDLLCNKLKSLIGNVDNVPEAE